MIEFFKNIMVNWKGEWNKTYIYILYIELFDLSGNVKRYKKTAVAASRFDLDLGILRQYLSAIPYIPEKRIKDPAFPKESFWDNH